MKDFANILAVTESNGGGTFSVATGKQIKPLTSYAVSLKGGFTQVFPTAQSLEAGLFASDVLDRAPYFGTWLNEGKLFVDPVVIVEDFDEAIDIAIENEQLAIYDFANQTDVTVAEIVAARHLVSDYHTC